MVTATGSIRASGAHAATTPTRPKTIRPQPDAHETSPCSRAFSSASLMHLCSGKRCNLAPALTARNVWQQISALRPASRAPLHHLPNMNARHGIFSELAGATARRAEEGRFLCLEDFGRLQIG